jgi:membrane protein DedA with SNARE-associated domain
MPGLRTPLFFTAGSIGIKYWRIILFDGVAALISVPALVLAGYFGAEHKDLVLKAARDTQLGVLGVIIVLFGGFLMYRRLRKRRQRPSTDAS